MSPEPTLTTQAVAALSAPTDREAEVLRRIALGQVSTDIARTLGVSLRTVEMDRSRLRVKLGGTSRAHLVGYAIEHGLI
jgi:DNA-binding CsgD family transcriptional regulator